MQNLSIYPNFKKYTNKNIICVDFGEKVIGLAAFCPGRDPFPLGRGKIINQGLNKFLEELDLIIEDDFIEVIVFGIPYLTDGSESEKTKNMKKVCQIIKERYLDLEVLEQDETLTTVTAKERMMNSPEFNFKVDPKRIDELSAIIILEDFIQRT